MFLNTNAIMVILENKLIHKGKDIQTQRYPDIPRYTYDVHVSITQVTSNLP